MLLDLAHWSVICALRRAGVKAIKATGTRRGGRDGRWLWRREQVEKLALERARVASLKAEGKKLCNGCETWKNRESEFAPSESRCRLCMTEKNKQKWARTKAQRVDVASRIAVIVQLAQVKVSDGSEYACMQPGFAHRPLPIVKTPLGPTRMSKREAYCQRCEAPRCFHYRDLTPKELVRRWKLSEGRIAAGMS